MKNKRYIQVVDGKVKSFLFSWDNPDPTIYKESMTGEIGQLEQADGSFIDDPEDLRRLELNKELVDIRIAKDKFDLGVITAEEYEPHRLRAIEIYAELEAM